VVVTTMVLDSNMTGLVTTAVEVDRVTAPEDDCELDAACEELETTFEVDALSELTAAHCSMLKTSRLICRHPASLMEGKPTNTPSGQTKKLAGPVPSEAVQVN
jgi:hypothetical protein